MIEETNVEVEVEEELEVNDEQDESRTDEEESGEESEVEAGSDAESDGESEERDIRGERQERAKAQIDRLKAEKAKLKEENERLKEGGQESVGTNSELVERTFLAANGIKDRDVQDEVIRLAHKFDVPVDEAMDDADIAGRAETLIKKKAAARTVAKGTGGAGTKAKGVNYYVTYFEKHGDFPDGLSSEMISKVTDKLAEK